MSCLSCKEAYDQERRPRVLQCGHSVCSSCAPQLHRLNFGVIPCPQCGIEDYCADVTKLAINLDLEARLTSVSLEEEEHEQDEGQEEAVAAGGSPTEGAGSPWDICSLHGDPLSSWCTTCHHAVCSECRRSHDGKHHQVFDHGQAKELLLSRYKDQSQAFLEWLVKVEAATRDTLEAAEVALPPLRKTLSLVQRHISQMRGHERTLEDAASLEIMEDLLDKSARWSKRSQDAAQQQVDVAAASLGRLESCMAELRRLQREVEDGFVLGAGTAAAASLPHSEEIHDEPGQQQQQDDATAPATRVVLAQRGPLSLSRNQGETIVLRRPDMEGRLGTRSPRRRSTTHIDFRAEYAGCWFWVDHQDDAGRFLFQTRWDFRGGSSGLVMVTLDQTRRRARDNPRRVDVPGCGLRVGAHHRARIEEDEEQYEVFLDGVALGSIGKIGGPRPPAVANIWLYSAYAPTHVSRILVETE